MISKIDQKIYESGGVVGLNYASNDQTVAMHNTYSNWQYMVLKLQVLFIVEEFIM